MVKIYTMPTCSWCDKAKEYLLDMGVDFEELNVADDMEARDVMLKKTKQMSVPVIEINDEFIIGFNEEKINELLPN